MAKGDNPVLAGVEHREAVKNAAVEEYYARQEGLQPTPTQRENDLAKVGAVDQVEDKEDDGSEWDQEGQIRVMTARLPGNNPYDTRDMEAEESSSPRRGRRSKSSD